MTPDIEPKKTAIDAAILYGGLFSMILLALLGGVARQAQQALSGKRVTWPQFFWRAIISVFIGVVCFFLLPTEPWSKPTSAMLGWMGADGVSLLLQLVLKKGKDE